MCSNYKCCDKLFANYVCTQCNSILHKSCVASGKFKVIRRLGNNKIICCNLDPEKDISLTALEDKNSILEETISELTQESEYKSRHLERIKLDYHSLLNEASTREDELNKIIHGNEMIIRDLEVQIRTLTCELEKFKCKITTSKSTQTTHNSKNRGVMTDSQMCVASRSTQTEVTNKTCNVMTETDNQFLDMNLSRVSNLQKISMESRSTQTVPEFESSFKATDQEIGILDEEAITKAKDGKRNLDPNYIESKDNTNKTISVSNMKQATMNPRKVLIFGDNSALNCASLIKNNINSNQFLIEGWVKPGADMDVFADSVFTMTKDHTCSDVVVLCFDLKYKAKLKKQYVDTLLSISKYTNVILCIKYDSVCLLESHKKFIAYINNFLTIKNKSIRVLYNVLENGYYRYKKNKMCRIISDYIMYNSNSPDMIVLKSVTMINKSSKMYSLNTLTKNLAVQGSDGRTAGLVAYESERVHRDILCPDSNINDCVMKAMKGRGTCTTNNKAFLYPRLSQWDLD